MHRQKTVLIVDGQGGGVGRKVAECLVKAALDVQYIVVGSNAAATSNMMKAGIAAGATGENAWLHNCAHADIIVGPIGAILPNAMRGEIAPAMAMAVADSPAKKVLIPVANHQEHVHIVGLAQAGISIHMDEMLKVVIAFIKLP